LPKTDRPELLLYEEQSDTLIQALNNFVPVLIYTALYFILTSTSKCSFHCIAWYTKRVSTIMNC